MCDSNPSSGQQNRYKRKRKKNFLKNARKYGKKGCFGRGSELDSDTYQYFVRILEAYKEGFPSDEEKGVFVNNVFEQTEGNEVTYSSNQLGCRVIQMLLPFANDSTLESYFDSFVANLRPLCCDRFASHVLQTLVEIASKKSHEDIAFKEKCQSTTIKVSRFLLNNLEDYLWDTYGNHVIRTVLKSLSRFEEANKEVPEEYREIVLDYAQRLISWPQFNELPFSELTSGFLQILLQALAKVHPKQLKVYLKKLLNECFMEEANSPDKSKLPVVFMTTSTIMLLEVCLEVATPKLFTQLYAKCFAGNLVALATKRSTNFCVQKLLTNCKEKVEFEAMFDEVGEHFEDILNAGHSGVILSVAQTCKRLAAKQGSFLNNLMKCFKCYEPEERQNSIVMCLCKFVNYEGLNKETVNLQKAKLNLHGTLIVQLLLEYNKPIKIVNGILSIDTNDLKDLFCNSMGSHVVDSYVKSQYVGEKSREKLARKLQGCYRELASTKYGSRSFEALWNAAHIKNKLNIMKELADKDGAWSNSEFGRIIAGKVNLHLYKRNVEEWKNSLNKTSKVEALFADLINN